MATQSDYRVTVALGDFDLAVTHFELHEALSTLFHCTIDVVESVYTSPSLRDSDIIDQEIDITLWQGDNVKRRLHGVIDSIAEGGSGPRYRAYNLRVTPALQRLDHTANCRIFQLKTADDIIGEILKQHSIAHVGFDLKRSLAQREYCVQYNETDLAFIERLAAEEGLIFWFEHNQGMHKLCFIDQIDALPPLPDTYTVRAQNANQNEASIWDFRYREQRVTSSSAQRDYTFKNPGYTLAQEHIGRFVDNQKQDYEHYSYNGRYKKDDQGKPFVQFRQEARQSAQRIATLTGDHLEFAAGQSIDIDGVSERHDHQWLSIANHLTMPQPQALQEDSVAVSANTAMGQETSQPKVTLITTCIPKSQPWRPEPKPKPVVDGPQMAHVVGPKGEEIFCDEFGRVRVQFPWDRYGKSDEHASCWIRVAQNWAGGQYGHMAIPRIGHEVIVAFLEGDPDQPIIMGRTYHQNNLPPYDLPANKTRMTIKSKTHQGDGFNEIRFEDEKEQEQVYLHGEKDLDIIIKNDRREHIQHDRDLKVDNDRAEEIGNDSHSKVERDRNEATGRKYSLTVGEEHSHQVGKKYQLNTGETQYFKSGQHIVLESGQSLTIQSSGGFIKIDGGGITIQGKMVNINEGGSPSVGTPVQANMAKIARLATDFDVSNSSQTVESAPSAAAPQQEVPKTPVASITPPSEKAPFTEQLKKSAQSHTPTVALGNKLTTPDESEDNNKKHYSLKAGVVLTTGVEDKISKLADAYFAQTGKDIVITSGTRSAKSQASAMYRKLDSGENILRLYKNQTAVKEIKKPYDDGVALNKKSSEVKTSMTKVIQNQIDSEVYISSHLKSGAVDVRSRGMSSKDKKEFKKAASSVAKKVLEESDHWHLEL